MMIAAAANSDLCYELLPALALGNTSESTRVGGY